MTPRQLRQHQKLQKYIANGGGTVALVAGKLKNHHVWISLSHRVHVNQFSLLLVMYR